MAPMDPFFIALLLYIVALVLAILDIFVPSGGMLVILASAAAVGAVLFGFRSSTTLGMAMLTVVAASIPVVAILTVKLWPHTPIGRRVILQLPTDGVAKHSSKQTALENWVGFVFLADAPLLPAGQIKVGHRHLNAIAEHGIIEVGQAVKVIAVRERNLIVRATREPITVLPEVTRPGQSTDTPPDDISPSDAPRPLDQRMTDISLLDRPAEDFGLESLDQ